MSDHAAQKPRALARAKGAIGYLVQRIARNRRAQRFLNRPRVARVTSVMIQASTVKGSARFVYRELSASGLLSRYTLRRTGRPILIRHNTADPLVLDEIFYTGHYELPDEVERVLNELNGPPRVLDLGANIGLFGVWALDRFPGAEITAFEPDPTNAAVARRCIDANGAGGRWQLIEAAAGDRDGRIGFRAGEFSRSRIEPGEGETEVDIVDVFPYLERADLAKIDIEGGEWAILTDPRFRQLKLAAIVLEYHPDQAPTADSRAFALEIVEGAGYETRLVFEFAEGQGMFWAWRVGQ
jgi:FkbM family methyltransferase